MIRLEELTHGQRVQGIVPQQTVTVIHASLAGASAELFYQRDDGRTGSLLLFRDHEEQLSYAASRHSWNMEADAAQLVRTIEAYRIHLAYLFDPLLAVHTSQIEPLPHQLTAVYDEMLKRQPLRFLLADDPGAGKTIMAGLLIKELMVRGDVQRCLICAPGSLTDQWQDELWTKFHLRFEILTRDKLEASYSGNPFIDEDRLIIRIDQVARSEELQERLRNSDWDLIICDEAHKMAASYFGRELKETKRYRLGKLMSEITRHFLLMTATPHNGKEEDFQLFMSLIDPDRFAGRYRPDEHETDVTDLMRRMVKEKLLRFDGRRLFPLRMAYTVDYPLSPAEQALYDAVTEYVREEFNKADRLQDGGRKGTVGFALTILQRRLASSPEAICQSLQRRRKRLQQKRKELEAGKALAEQWESVQRRNGLSGGYDEADWDELSDFPDADFEELEIELVDSATAALSIAELDAEIATLQRLERQAAIVRRSGDDRKWEELAGLIQHEVMSTTDGRRRKLVIFSEHRDTLDYLHERITTLLGTPEAVVAIHGGIRRGQRLEIQDRFRNDPNVTILIATDAAGEGINLQRANLMVNYDLPWNPNRIEQRFGRIHRIGQEEACHLWNMVAGKTREGQVYRRLLQKIETESHALNGQVFDVLGNLFTETPLRQLLVKAIREGEQPEVQAYLNEVVDNAADKERIRDLLEQNLLAEQVMDLSAVERIRADMERANARRLQPYYIKLFFLAAFAELGGRLHEREPGRYQASHVPFPIRDHATTLGGRRKVLREYERICFEKELVNQPGKPQAEFICPGHILLDAIIDLVLKQQGGLLNEGAVLVDDRDPSEEPRALYFVEHTIHDQRPGRTQEQHPISRVVRFVEVDAAGAVRNAGDAPYLDYRPLTDEERRRLKADPQLVHYAGSNGSADLEATVRAHAVARLAPEHLEEVQARRLKLIDKTHRAVRKRLTREIHYWDQQAGKYREQEREGKRNARLNRQQAERRAKRLEERLQQRERELEEERRLSASPPVIVGRALVVPIGMLLDEPSQPLLDRRITEQIAMHAVMEAEIAQGHHPQDVSAENRGYDIESLEVRTGRLRFLEVKGRRAGAETVTVTHNEILKAFNSGDQYALVVVDVEDKRAKNLHYIWAPPLREPTQIVASVNLRLSELYASTSPIVISVAGSQAPG